ncbi:bestrophin family protein [Burkholderia gladioli]|uniref:bestrophin family protein n=1 Tax=Burkholderia gladioli TaxID=28095 RepID=UPI001641E46B|nr:bestrophin family ion channel [Burkholderia gladioli]
MILPGVARFSPFIRYVAKPLLLLLVWDVGVTYFWSITHIKWFDYPNLPLTLLGSVIAVYLSFRNNIAYARWTEARFLWGSVVNCSRTLARESIVFLTDPRDVEIVARRQVAYVNALRSHLRSQEMESRTLEDLSRSEINSLERVGNVPNMILCNTARYINSVLRSDIIRSKMAVSISDVTNAQGGLERIKNTPIPQQYASMPKVFTHLFCILLPIGLVETLGWFTPLGSAVVGFLLLALLQIGDDIQNPFANMDDDVPMSSLCRTIEIDLFDMAGIDHDLTPFKPKKGVLI